jgi:hypothetical protein
MQEQCPDKRPEPKFKLSHYRKMLREKERKCARAGLELRFVFEGHSAIMRPTSIKIEGNPMTLRTFMNSGPKLLLTLILPLLFAVPAAAHHSAALFYGTAERVTLTGEVARFNFRNPHAILELVVTNDKGEVERWTCETSAPSALRRRGWSQDSVTAGEIVTLEGILASDGTKLMRITKITKADGTEVGVTGRLDD